MIGVGFANDGSPVNEPLNRAEHAAGVVALARDREQEFGVSEICVVCAQPKRIRSRRAIARLYNVGRPAVRPDRD